MSVLEIFPNFVLKFILWVIWNRDTIRRLALEKKKTAHEFIEFLVAECVIDSEKAENIKEIWRTRLRFGIIALREGFISPDDLFHVLQEQSANEDRSVKIGEILLSKNLMTAEQIEKALSIQASEDDIDVEIFAESGLLPYELIADKLREFLDK